MSPRSSTASQFQTFKKLSQEPVQTAMPTKVNISELARARWELSLTTDRPQWPRDRTLGYRGRPTPPPSLPSWRPTRCNWSHRSRPAGAGLTWRRRRRWCRRWCCRGCTATTPGQPGCQRDDRLRRQSRWRRRIHWGRTGIEIEIKIDCCLVGRFQPYRHSIDVRVVSSEGLLAVSFPHIPQLGVRN